MSGINLDNLSADQMLAGAAALQGDAKDYSNTQDVEGMIHHYSANGRIKSLFSRMGR